MANERRESILLNGCSQQANDTKGISPRTWQLRRSRLLSIWTLPWLVDEIVESGEMLAAQIHSQASRGLQEAVQNAQDQELDTSGSAIGSGPVGMSC